MRQAPERHERAVVNALWRRAEGQSGDDLAPLAARAASPRGRQRRHSDRGDCGRPRCRSFL